MLSKVEVLQRLNSLPGLIIGPTISQFVWLH